MGTVYKILVTSLPPCPPVLGMIDSFQPLFNQHGLEVTAPKVVQALSGEELIELVPPHDGWIIGDHPATSAVFEAGDAGRLKAAMKWGIGVDKVDFAGCKDLDNPITNTPNMFGAEDSDIAMGYIAILARDTFQNGRFSDNYIAALKKAGIPWMATDILAINRHCCARITSHLEVVL